METLKSGAQSKGFRPFIFFILWITLPLFLVPLVVSHILKDPDPQDLKSLTRAALATGNKAESEAYARQLATSEPNNPVNHLMYLWVHFDRSASQRNDREPLTLYKNWAQSQDPNLVDIGHLGLGTYYLYKEDGQRSLNHLNQVKDSNMKNLRIQIGRAFMLTKDFKSAEQAFIDETKIPDGNITRAVRYLAQLYDKTHNYTELDNLYQNQQFKKDIPAPYIRNLAIKKCYPLTYIKSLFLRLQDSVNWIGVIGACLILIVWSIFLRRLDVFEPEKLRFVFLTLLMGMLASFLCLPLYDFAQIYLNFTHNGGIVNDLIFCVFGIGFFEELVKILPLLIMIKFTRQVNESIDFVIYASLSALGFSFIENIGYFDTYSLYIINERGMICSTGHMFYSSLVVYGYILARYRKRGSVMGNILVSFFLAILIHGLYDFFLICEGLDPEFRAFSFLIILANPLLFVRIVNNTLNQSEYFDINKANQIARMREFLAISLTGIVLFEYTALSYKFGPKLTNLQSAPAIFIAWWMVFFFATSLGNYQIRRGYWLPLKPKGRKNTTDGSTTLN